MIPNKSIDSDTVASVPRPQQGTPKKGDFNIFESLIDFPEFFAQFSKNANICYFFTFIP